MVDMLLAWCGGVGGGGAVCSVGLLVCWLPCPKACMWLLCVRVVDGRVWEACGCDEPREREQMVLRKERATRQHVVHRSCCLFNARALAGIFDNANTTKTHTTMNGIDTTYNITIQLGWWVASIQRPPFDF
jgi:hypothetical protein